MVESSSVVRLVQVVFFPLENTPLVVELKNTYEVLFPLKLQTINFTEPFYAAPVVLVTPKRSNNNSDSVLPESRCNAVTAWVEVSNTLRDN